MDKHVSIKLKFCLITLLFGFFILSSKLVLATDYYVAGDTGLDTNSGNSSLPWKTIQKAADTVIAGDTVNVKGGISYTGSNSCGSPYTAVICLTRSGTAESFISFQSWSGTGIPTINAAGAFFRYGFGVNLSGSGVNYIKINGFIIKDAYYGIVGIGIGNIFINNVIYDTATYTTAGIVTTSESSSSYVYNNTIFNTLIGIYAGQGQTIAKNNIVLNARYQGFTISSGMYVSLVMDYNNVYNTTGGNNYPVGILVREGHDLSVDPQFENTEGYDFRLKSTSVLVDAGINLPDVSSDIDNTSRPQGNKFDMGAYESDYTQILPPNAIPATFYTSPSNLMTLLAQYTGEMTQSQFAMQNTYSSLYVGDINTDGYDDVLVGGRHTVPNGGFYAFFGKTTATNTEALNANVIIRGTISGSRISDNVSMGDIDGDGKNELLITDYNAFKAYIFKTGTGFSSTDVSTTNATISGPNHFGVGSAILGDVNGDGYDDYIVYADTGKKAYLFYGSPTIGDKSYTEANVVYSVDADISFTRPGDVSGDGLKDIVISCAGCNSGHGAIYIFYGSSNLTNKTLSQADVIISGDSYPYSLGTWSALSDVNGDGIDDIITVNGSKTFVFFGSNTLTNKTSINANVTISNGIQFTESSGPGFSVESADINNDIYKDLIVTDYWIPRTYVFFGPLTTSKTTDQADLVYDYRETQKGYVGGPIATGDVNNDGYIDIITGDGQYNQRTGKVWLFTSPHGTPSISLNNMGNTNNLTITGSVSDTLTVGGVEVSTDNGSWNTCTVSSGNFYL